jgi:thiol-disulfide isomerase/thioredoxin
MLVLAVAGPASAQGLAPPSVLKLLDLRAYRSRTLSPAFSGSTVEGRSLSTTELRGKVVVLNFWASWCRECRPEMPALDRLHRDLAPRGLIVVGVNAREDREAVRRYGKDVGVSFPLVLDPDGTINGVYGVIALPTTFVVGRDGRAIAVAIGPRDWGSPSARTVVETLLGEPASHPDAR